MDSLLTWYGLIIWGVLLLIQNFSFTLVSRARNSGSIAYHAVAAIGSNGVWFASQFILIGNFIQIMKTADWWTGIGLGLFYTVCTVVGSISSHYVCMRWIEKGKRAVGGRA
jgi:hypothetical protein